MLIDYYLESPDASFNLTSPETVIDLKGADDDGRGQEQHLKPSGDTLVTDGDALREVAPGYWRMSSILPPAMTYSPWRDG